MRAGMCAGERGDPRSTDRTGGGGSFVVPVYRGEVMVVGVGVSVGAVSHECPAPKEHHPKRRLTRKVETRAYAPRARQSSALPAAIVAPVRTRPEGETEQTPRPRNEPWNPPDLPPEPGPPLPIPGPGEAEVWGGAGGGGGGEETQPGEHVKSLRRGRWKITLAPSRPVLLCAARRAIFPKKLSKTKSAPFGSAALGPPPVGQASTFRGRVGAIRAALRRGCWAGGFPAEPPTPAPPAPPRPPRPQPASLGPAAPAPAPRLSPPLKPTGGKGIFWGGLVLDTSRGTWGTRSRCPPAPPPPSPSRPGAAPGAGGQRQLLQKLGMKKLKA